jgi:hypothetical protein
MPRHSVSASLSAVLPAANHRFTPEFNPVQQAWTQMRAEYAAAQEIVRHWRAVSPRSPATNMLFLALLFMMLRTPDP